MQQFDTSSLADPPTYIPHDQVHTSLVYPLSPSDNVTVNISLPVSGIYILKPLMS